MTNALILIIEDEPEIAEIIETYFAREGFRVICAGDGPTGLSHHHRLRPDLVVLDIKLPGQDGYDVLTAIRRRDDTPVNRLRSEILDHSNGKAALPPGNTSESLPPAQFTETTGTR